MAGDPQQLRTPRRKQEEGLKLIRESVPAFCNSRRKACPAASAPFWGIKRQTFTANGELVHLPLVRGSARCRAHSPGSITDGLGCGFIVLMSSEAGIGALGRSPADQVAAYGSLAGAIGLAAQVIFATFPVIQVRWR
jgi:hypothetical protein